MNAVEQHLSENWQQMYHVIIGVEAVHLDSATQALNLAVAVQKRSRSDAGSITINHGSATYAHVHSSLYIDMYGEWPDEYMQFADNVRAEQNEYNAEMKLRYNVQ
jgi:hypothetical protein